MRRLLLLLLVAHAALARDVVIPPLIEPPATDAISLTAEESLETVTAQASACLEDVACPAASLAFDAVLDASRAIAYLRFVRNGRPEVCTGALVSDAAGSRTPYLVTARHCIDSAETAAAVEIIWDLRSASCGSNRMASYTRTYGAELLVASEETDVALLKLKSVPPGRVFLGIDTRPLEPGTPVHRVSHAGGLSQTFVAGVVEESGWTCPRAPRRSFVYSKPTAGGIATGSSGAPLLARGLYVVGQLLGLCGAAPSNPCAPFNDMVDGAIRESWPLLAPYLDPAPPMRKRRAAR
ncbi:MAG TPA: serine protease [Thermoanaerobaculia bacterium]